MGTPLSCSSPCHGGGTQEVCGFYPGSESPPIRHASPTIPLHLLCPAFQTLSGAPLHPRQNALGVGLPPAHPAMARPSDSVSFLPFDIKPVQMRGVLRNLIIPHGTVPFLQMGKLRRGGPGSTFLIRAGCSSLQKHLLPSFAPTPLLLQLPT